MNRKSLLLGSVASLREWDPNAKESWFVDLEKEPVNDERWSCVVTAAVQSEAQDEECIQIYRECVSTGLRKAVKIVSMADVVKLLKENNGSSSVSILNMKKRRKKEDGNGKAEKQEMRTGRVDANSLAKHPPPRFSQILDLAAKYAMFTETECKLPPELVAGVLKFIVLRLKEENCLQRRIDAVRERKKREQNIKAKFVRELKPYEVRQEEETTTDNKTSQSLLDLQEPINDEPLEGPDLYILLTDFYNPLYFLHLQSMNVPFLAIVKISWPSNSRQEKLLQDSKLEASGRKRSVVAAFWEKLTEQSVAESPETAFKDMAMMEYRAPPRTEDLKQTYRTIFDELSWTQYSAYCIYRQHQKYLKELLVQRLVVSLEPLDLSRCEVYNKLCDGLVTGEPLTPLLVLYAMVEQVVVGVPLTGSEVFEAGSTFPDYFASRGADSPESSAVKLPELVTPCKECRQKKWESNCDKLKQVPIENQKKENLEESARSLDSTFSRGSEVPEEGYDETTSKYTGSLIEKVLSERRTEREVHEDKTWKAPSLCLYGDSLLLQSYHCDPRLFDSEVAFDRFLRNADLPRVWTKYPKPSREDGAFLNFHFHNLRKISQETEELLKLKIFFFLAMKLIGDTEQYRAEEDEKQPEKQESRGEDGNFQQVDEHKKKFPDNLKDGRSGSLVKWPSNGFQESGSSQIDWTSRSKIFPERSSPLENGGSAHEGILATFYALLDCDEISSFNEPLFPKRNESFMSLVEGFKFYEKLEPKLMVQRLLEARENFNRTQYFYFAPTDTLVLTMHNAFDYRGVHDAHESGVLLTPVSLRDFHNHVYPHIGTWLMEEEAEHGEFVADLAEKLKEKREKKDAEYLRRLQMQYCRMTDVERKEFLETEVDVKSEPIVTDKELSALPVKPRFRHSEKVSFVATDFSAVRVQIDTKNTEFRSLDGTRVNVAVDTWLHSPQSLIKVGVRRSKFSLIHYHQVENDVGADFIFTTNTDVVFAFSKSPEVGLNYRVRISWPTGLLVNPTPQGSGILVKQSYLKPYRKGWEIEGEISRCFFKNGQVLILKETGDYDVLFGSGQKICFFDSSSTPEYEVVTSTGEVWRIRTKGCAKNKKKLLATNKILIGTDPKTEETFYKREDGVRCMLWPNGTLVTTYPDGTKITGVPSFDQKEVFVEWSEDEKFYFSELQSKHKSEGNMQEPKSRTILRNPSHSLSTPEARAFDADGFVSVSCGYLMEHPKYSSVSFECNSPYVKVSMPDNLNVQIYPKGNYHIQQDEHCLTVYNSSVVYYVNCSDCDGRSTVKFNLDSNVILCQLVDFFRRAFFVYRDGRTRYEERYQTNCEEEFANELNVAIPCPRGHLKRPSLNQRCFAFERDLSGVEFLHEDSLALSYFQIPETTHFQFDTDDPKNISHTTNSPYYKIGYEKWGMEYQEKSNTQPRILKKYDLKEMGVKHIFKNCFKYPFPKHHNCGVEGKNNYSERQSVDEPKVIVSRTVKCLSQNPPSVVEELQTYVARYQEKARELYDFHVNHRPAEDRSQDSRYVKMRLQKIALTLSQSLNMYPHLCTNLPSTEKDIHYFGHFINLGKEIKNGVRDPPVILPDCAQIPNRLPRQSDFSSICEESESPSDT